MGFQTKPHRLFSDLLLTISKNCDIITDGIERFPERAIRWRLLPLIGDADSFCLPERGGDANVRYVGAVVLACRTHYSAIELLR